jgi:ribokinase
MQSFVVGNVTIDTTLAIADFPLAGESIQGQEVATGLGGKGCNQAIVMARAGVKTTLVAGLGDDGRGEVIRGLLSAEPVETELCLITGAASDAALILSADGENANITTSSAAEGLTIALCTEALAGAEPGDLLVLQGNLSDETTLALLQFGREKGLVTAFNPSPLRASMGSMLAWVDILFVNEAETLALAGVAGEAAGRVLMERGPKQVLLTMGGAGSMLVDDTGVVVVPAVPCPVVDTTGAGDTFMAVALASAALRGTRLDRRAMEDASAASALTVSRMGTQVAFPTAGELAAILAGATGE